MALKLKISAAISSCIYFNKTRCKIDHQNILGQKVRHRWLSKNVILFYSVFTVSVWKETQIQGFMDVGSQFPICK